jgi:hypothetical protein
LFERRWNGGDARQSNPSSIGPLRPEARGGTQVSIGNIVGIALDVLGIITIAIIAATRLGHFRAAGNKNDVSEEAVELDRSISDRVCAYFR